MPLQFTGAACPSTFSLKMKRNTIAVVAVLIGVGFLALDEPRYKDMDKIRSSEFADVEFPSGVRGKVDVGPIRDTLANAEWISRRPINKGGYWIRIEGVPEIFLSEVNGCYWLTGYRGIFKVDADHIPSLYTYLDAQQGALQRDSTADKNRGEQGRAHQSTTRPESKFSDDSNP